MLHSETSSAAHAAFMHGRMALAASITAAAWFFPTVIDFIHGRPSARFRHAGGHAAFFVSFRDMFGLSLLFSRIFGFLASRHKYLLFFETNKRSVELLWKRSP